MKIKLLGLIVLSALLLGCSGDNEIDSEATNITGTATITGLTQLGEQLTASLSDPNGTFFNAPGTGISAYIWSADGAAIPGADQMQYTLTAAEVGSAITVTIAYVDNAGFSEVVISAPTVEVTSGPPNVAGSVSISGTPQANQTLTASVIDANGFNNDATYEWLNGSTSVQDSASNQYVLPGSVVVDDQITVIATYTDADGYSESPISAAVAVTPPGPMSGEIINDSFADVDRTRTGAVDADWWSSSDPGGNSVEIDANGLGLVSGSSGRGIHATFTPQTLDVGDSITVTYAFTTPASVGTNRGGAFKVALMDGTNAGLAADTFSSSGAPGPNPLYTNLPGYMADFDINTASEDITIREHDAPNTVGRFLGTSTGWTSLGNSPDDGYAFTGDTDYVGVLTITRTGTDTADILASLSVAGGAELVSHTESDASGIANDFGMLGFWANSNTFGTSNTAGAADNGITFTNVTIETTAASSSSGLIDDGFADIDRTATNTGGEADADWWSSSDPGGNSVEIDANGLGLVSGSSGRGIHATFTPQTLDVGDSITVTYAFTTPASVGTNRGGAFKVALMDGTNAGLAADTFSSSGAPGPNPLYTNLPGYMADFDINTASEDITIREHDAPNTVGRFLGTSTGWTSLGNSPDDGYAFTGDTDYVGVLTITRTGTDTADILASLSVAGGAELVSHTESDASGIANDFGMLGFWANSNTFGTSNTAGAADNGITFTNVLIEVSN